MPVLRKRLRSEHFGFPSSQTPFTRLRSDSDTANFLISRLAPQILARLALKTRIFYRFPILRRSSLSLSRLFRHSLISIFDRMSRFDPGAVGVC